MKRIIVTLGIGMASVGVLFLGGWFYLDHKLNSIWFVELVDESMEKALFYIDLLGLIKTGYTWLISIGILTIIVMVVGSIVIKKIQTKVKNETL